MKITATKEERNQLIMALDDSGLCMFEADCEEEDNDITCKECLKRRIEWEIVSD